MQCLANFVTDEELEKGMCFPRVSKIREVALHVATAVANQALEEGLCRDSKRIGDVKKYISDQMYDPKYHPLINQVY